MLPTRSFVSRKLSEDAPETVLDIIKCFFDHTFNTFPEVTITLDGDQIVFTCQAKEPRFNKLLLTSINATFLALPRVSNATIIPDCIFSEEHNTVSVSLLSLKNLIGEVDNPIDSGMRLLTNAGGFSDLFTLSFKLKYDEQKQEMTTLPTEILDRIKSITEIKFKEIVRTLNEERHPEEAEHVKRKRGKCTVQ